MNTTIGLKKCYFGLLLTILCNAQSFAQEQVIQKKELPEKALDFIKKNFSKESIRSAYKETEYFFISKYSVLMDNGTELEFDTHGNWTEVESKKIPRSIVTTNIQAHIQKSFPGTEIIKVSRGRRRIEVELSNGLDLLFDNKGKFIREDD